jgi:hypothetical protein
MTEEGKMTVMQSEMNLKWLILGLIGLRITAKLRDVLTGRATECRSMALVVVVVIILIFFIIK